MIHSSDKYELQSPQLLTRADLSDRLKLSMRTISRLITTGRLPAPIRLGHSVRWRTSDIDAWIERGCPAMDARRNRS